MDVGSLSAARKPRKRREEGINERRRELWKVSPEWTRQLSEAPYAVEIHPQTAAEQGMEITPRFLNSPKTSRKSGRMSEAHTRNPEGLQAEEQSHHAISTREKQTVARIRPSVFRIANLHRSAK
jgi:hypothetical protein